MFALYYFNFDNKFYKHFKRLTMGASLTPVSANFCMDVIESTKFYDGSIC